jgi:hypothetical protein
MKTTIIALLLASYAFAAETTTSLTPLGFWPLCNIQALTAVFICPSVPDPASEGYILWMQAINSSTVAFRYSVTATMASDGSIKTLSGLTARTGETSMQTLYFGGPILHWSIQVEELVVTDLSVSVK